MVNFIQIWLVLQRGLQHGQVLGIPYWTHNVQLKKGYGLQESNKDMEDCPQKKQI